MLSRSTRLSAVTFACLTMGFQTSAQDAQSSGTRDYPVSKGDNAVIGLPYDTVTGTFLGPQSCLESYTEIRDEGTRGAFDQRLLQVSSTLGLMDTLKIDVSASGKLFGTSVTGKMGFAKSMQLDQTALNYALYANYDGPEIRIAPEGTATIAVTPNADALWTSGGEASFRAKCGDAFVSRVYTGAQAYAVLEFSSVDQKTRTDISGEIQAKGTGWSADAKANKMIESQSGSNQLSITYSQIGGAPPRAVSEDGTPVDTTWGKLQERIAALQNTPDVVKVGFQVQSYDKLISWPDERDLTPSPELLKLAYHRAAYGTLLNTLKPLANAPFDAEFTHVFGRNQNGGAGDQDSLSQLRTEVIAHRDAMDKLYAACATWKVTNAPESCADTAALSGSIAAQGADPYALMARLPLKMVSRSKPVEAFYDQPTLVDAIFAQYLVTAANAYCNQASDTDRQHPGCVDTGTLRMTYRPSIDAAITPIWEPAPRAYSFVSEHRRDATCLTAREKSSKDKTLFMRTCAAEAQKAKQRLDWVKTGQIRIRGGECVAGHNKANGPVAPHNCASREGQQMWRFIPLERKTGTTKPGTKGLLQEAGFGRCLDFGVPKAGELTLVKTNACDAGNDIFLWRFVPQ
ncbi:MAG: ricin-type beta-trefoil lectin domain protein [Pseudomonadota bacterium]